MKTPHKHADLIKQWADGAEVQFKYKTTGLWTDTKEPRWVVNTEYRLKPETVKYRLYLYKYQEDLSVVSCVSGRQEIAQALKGFVRWLSDWQEVEV